LRWLAVKVILSEQNSEIDIPILLGRAVFFDKFSITFKQKEERIELRALSEKL